jgi:hypothetical protein
MNERNKNLLRQKALKRTLSTKPTNAIFLALALCAPPLLAACADRREQSEAVTQATPTPTAQAQNSAATQPTQTPQPPATATPTPRQPQASEVNDKLARIFQGAVQTDAGAAGGALVGDFNGDGSEDVAVVVKPAADRLEEINSEVANWILGDLQKVVVPDPTKAVQKLPAAERVRVQPGDALLAVIHGFERGGWRTPEAQQAYLLRNAAGREPRVEPRQEAAEEFKALVPHLGADIIREEIGGARGFIYWTGGKYAWFAPARRAAK